MGLPLLVMDCETTGLDRNRCEVISFCLIKDELGSTTPVEELPSCKAFIRLPEPVTWEPYAFNMHRAIVGDLAGTQTHAIDGVPVLHSRIEVTNLIRSFAGPTMFSELDPASKLKYTIAGKNPGFDVSFMRPYLQVAGVQFHGHRTLDPTLWFVEEGDEAMPSLEECMKRAGLEPTALHTAWGDALDVLKLIRVGWSRTKGEPR